MEIARTFLSNSSKRSIRDLTVCSSCEHLRQKELLVFFGVLEVSWLVCLGDEMLPFLKGDQSLKVEEISVECSVLGSVTGVKLSSCSATGMAM